MQPALAMGAVVGFWLMLFESFAGLGLALARLAGANAASFRHC